MRGDYQYRSVSVPLDLFVIAPPLAGHYVRLVACALVNTAAATTYTFLSSGGTALSGAMSPEAGAVIVLPFTEVGWLRSVVGEGLSLDVSGAVRGMAVYEYIPDAA